MSYADDYTDEKLNELERKINQVYSEAQKDLEKRSREYFEYFAKRDEEYRKLVETGEITEEDYKKWRLNQIGRGGRFNKMAADMAERATKANEVAIAYVNDATPSIYSLNRNHEAYLIEQLGYDMSVNGDFTLYNESTVRRMLVNNPEVMPYYPESAAVRRGIDLEYGQKVIKAKTTSGILQGKSVYKIADDLQRDITDMNRASAVRAARTAVTSAQNGGRMDSMLEAQAMGIKLRKRWVSAKDSRTRDAHGSADGQTVNVDEPFIVGGEELMFPGDRSSASGWNLYNCRCGMRSVEKKGIEAEQRQTRIQNPKYTDALEAEEKAKAQYERALAKEQAETDKAKKAELKKSRLEKQQEYEYTQKIRRGTQKNIVVNGEMTYKEWEKLRGSSSNNKLTSSKKNGILKEIKKTILNKESNNKVGVHNTEKSVPKGSQLFDKEVRKKLLENEQINNGNRYERALIYDSNGKMKFMVKGDNDSVKFSRKQVSQMKNCIISHNHPNNSCFSGEDIYSLKITKASEIRASTRYGTYVLNPPAKWSDEISSFDKVDKIYNEYVNNYIISYKDKAAQEGKPLMYYMQQAEEEATKEFANKYGFSFRKEIYNEI